MQGTVLKVDKRLYCKHKLQSAWFPFTIKSERQVKCLFDIRKQTILFSLSYACLSRLAIATLPSLAFFECWVSPIVSAVFEKSMERQHTVTGDISTC